MTQSSKTQDAKVAEKQRLAEALRANLRRRKTAKGSKAVSDGAPTSAPASSDGNEG